MTSYGYRLFCISVKKNGRGEPKPLTVEQCGEKMHFSDYLESLLKKQLHQEVHGRPKPLSVQQSEDAADTDDDAPTPQLGRPVLCLLDVTRRGDHLTLDLLYGNPSTFTHAGFHEDKKVNPIELAGLKNVRPYRAVFILPKQGEFGIFAMEDADRTCPDDLLKSWIRSWAKQEALELEFKSSVSMANGEVKKKKKEKVDWWSPHFTPMNDPERLAAVMQNGSSSKIVLKKKGLSNANTPGTQEVKIEMGLTEAGFIARARALISKWFPDGAPEATSQAEANDQLAAILAEGHGIVSDEAYDDAWIEIKDNNGKTTKISPSRWADIFVYPIGRGQARPLNRDFYGPVKKTASRLETSLGIKIEWSGWG